MKTSPKLLLTVLFFAFGVCSSFATSISLNPTMDALVTTGPSGNLSSSNYGAAGALGISAPGSAKGEFQSVMQFNLASVKSTLDGLYGAGDWTVQSVTLQLNAAPNNNAIFNNPAAGQFTLSLMQNNSWTAGNGTPAAPSATGINFNTLQNTYINNSTDQTLGTFSFAGGTSGLNTYTLTLSSGLVADLFSGAELSLRGYAADSVVSYLFNSEDFGTAADRPLLTVTAVPEPATFGISLLGIALLGVCRRWQQR